MIAERPQQMLATILDGTRRSLDFRYDSWQYTQVPPHQFWRNLWRATSRGHTHRRGFSRCSESCPCFLGLWRGQTCSRTNVCAVYQAAFPIECKISRCFAVCWPAYFPSTHYTSPSATFSGMQCVMRPSSLKGDGTPKRSYMYAADLAIWLWTMLFSCSVVGPYQCGVGSIYKYSRTGPAPFLPPVLVLSSRVHDCEITRAGGSASPIRSVHRKVRWRSLASHVLYHRA